jgi:hypothetical protein
LHYSDRKAGPPALCRDTRELLPEYVEGDLGPVEKSRVAGHLRLCDTCRAEEARFMTAFAALNAPRAPQPHGDLYAAFSSKLAGFEHRGASRWGQLRWAAGAACLLLVVGVGATVVVPRLMPTDTRGGIAAHEAPVVASTPPKPRKQGGQRAAAPLPKPIDNVPVETPVETPGNSEIVTPRPAATVVALTPPRRQPRAAQREPKDFWDVRDARGQSAKDLIGRVNAPRRPTVGAAPEFQPPYPLPGGTTIVRDAQIPGAPRVTVVVPTEEENVAPGGTVTRIRRETGYDEQGQIALIRIKEQPPAAKDGLKEGTKDGVEPRKPRGPAEKTDDRETRHAAP